LRRLDATTTRTSSPRLSIVLVLINERYGARQQLPLSRSARTRGISIQLNRVHADALSRTNAPAGILHRDSMHVTNNRRRPSMSSRGCHPWSLFFFAARASYRHSAVFMPSINRRKSRIAPEEPVLFWFWSCIPISVFFRHYFMRILSLKKNRILYLCLIIVIWLWACQN